jgi:hypothetical protein
VGRNKGETDGDGKRASKKERERERDFAREKITYKMNFCSSFTEI